MGDVSLDVEVDDISLALTLKVLEEKLKEGAVEGIENTTESGKEAAISRLEQERRPFNSPHLRKSFSTNTIEKENEIEGLIANPLEQAAYVDKGVSGTQNQRNTPFSYDDEMPPLEPLIEWVEENLQGWDIDTDFDPPFDPNSDDYDDDSLGDEDSGPIFTSREEEIRQSAREEFNSRVDYDEDVIGSEEEAYLDDKSKFENAIRRAYQQNVDDDRRFTAVDELYSVIKDWKTGESDYSDDNLRKHLINTALAFDEDGVVPSMGPVSSLDDSQLEEYADVRYQYALHAFKAISEEFVKNSQLQTEAGKLKAYRNLRFSAGELMRKVFDRPGSDEYRLDFKVIENYAIDRDKLKFISASTFIHEREIDIEDDLFYHVDAFFENKWDNETEIHTRAGIGAILRSQNIDVRSDTYFDALDRIADFSFENNLWGSFPDKELLALAGPIRAMALRDDTEPLTPEGRDRLREFGEEFIDRELYDNAGISGGKSDWRDWTDINQGSAIDDYNLATVNAADNYGGLGDGQSITPVWREALEELSTDELKDSIWHSNDLEPEDAETLQAYLWLEGENQIPVYQSPQEETKFTTVGDLVDFRSYNNDDEDERKVEARFRSVVRDMDSVIAALAISTIDDVKIKDWENDANGSHNAVTDIINISDDIVSQKYKLKRVMAHEVGHRVHNILGIPARNYDLVDNRGEDPEDWKFGITDGSVSPDLPAQDAFDFLKGIWDKYKQNPDAVEIRPYQWRHPVELLAVSHAHLIYRESKLESYMPEMDMFWQKYEYGRNFTSSYDDLKTGSKVVIDIDDLENQQMIKVQEVKYEDGSKILVDQQGNEWDKSQIDSLKWRAVI